MQFLWLLAIGGGRDERFKGVNESWDGLRCYNPHLVVFDLAILVRQNIAQPNYPAPGNLWMVLLNGSRYPSCRLSQDFQVSLDSTSQHTIV